MDCAAALQLQKTPRVVLAFFALAKSITQLTLCQVTTDEVDAAKTARQGIPEASRYPRRPIPESLTLKLPYARCVN